jgi:hypothetical protein
MDVGVQVASAMAVAATAVAKIEITATTSGMEDFVGMADASIIANQRGRLSTM